jgi:hypothetical protein
VQTFGITIDTNEPPSQFWFELENTSGTATPNWGCRLAHPDGSTYIELWTSGQAASNPPGIPTNPVPGNPQAGPVDNPPPESWYWDGNQLRLYFYWLCTDERKVPADNTGLQTGVQPGSPLQVNVIGGEPGGKKIKILYPGPVNHPQE